MHFFFKNIQLVLAYSIKKVQVVLYTSPSFLHTSITLLFSHSRFRSEFIIFSIILFLQALDLKRLHYIN